MSNRTVRNAVVLGTGAPSWVPRASSVPMDGFLDFTVGKYWPSHYSNFLQGSLTVDGNGLAIGNAIDITGTAALVDALNDPEYTVFAEISPGLPSAALNTPVVMFSATEGPLFVVFQTGQAWSYKTNAAGSAVTLDRYGRFCGNNRRICASQNASGRTICQNGAPVATIATTHTANPASVTLGRIPGSAYSASGYIRQLGWWKNRKIANNDQVALTLPYYSLALPAGYSNAYRGFYNQTCNVGNNVLQYEYTQPWSMWCKHALVSTPDLTGNSLAAVIHTNVTNVTSFPGWETFLRVSSVGDVRLCVRLINDVTTHMVSVYGSTNLYDGAFHTLGSSWDGSGNASGVALYVDGVAETLTIEQDNLGGNSIISGTQTLLIGNQTGRLGYYDMGFNAGIHLSNVARNAAYFAANVTNPPAIDGNTALAYDWSGTTTAITDLSGNGRNAALSTIASRYTP